MIEEYLRGMTPMAANALWRSYQAAVWDPAAARHNEKLLRWDSGHGWLMYCLGALARSLSCD